MTDFVSFAHNHVIALAPFTIFVKEYFLILGENWSPFHTSVTEITAICSQVTQLMNSDVS
jgi:uncharacterized protein (UPF0262 family)